ncbi:MAG: TIM-barrel domain-containing protein [Tepidisphaeraceae bacterium]
MNRPKSASVLVSLAVMCLTCGIAVAAEDVVLSTATYKMRINPDGFRYGFEKPDGAPWLAAHARSGLQIGKGDHAASDVIEATAKSGSETEAAFAVKTKDGISATVTVKLTPHRATISVKPSDDGSYRIVARTAGLASPAYGLSDHGGSGRHTATVNDYVNDDLRSGLVGRRSMRLISNFVIFPQDSLAVVNIEPARKVVRVTEAELAQGSRDVREMPTLAYFFGTPKEIYADYLALRNEGPVKFYRPKYAFFGVGWEAFGALEWDTNEKTVYENVTKYLDAGYPLSWMVVGSGFWPRHDPKFHATTSFGMWDEKLYPHPKEFIEQFKQRGLTFLVGLRISFITEGPFAEEGVKGGYFIKDDTGAAKVFKIAFPKSPCYLLDAQNPAAVDWYIGLCQKWIDFGVDGFKEDLFGYSKYVLRDDKVDPIHAKLMDKGVFIMGRNGYFGSPADVHRYEDFNYNQPQDRGPINGLAFAYSGFPYVYPDIIGGTQVKTFPKADDPVLRRYLMRYAMYAAVNPSMSVGYGPWNTKDAQTEKVVLEAAKLHARLHPYIYSAAVEASIDGFPHPHAPLPLVFPQDKNVYGRENSITRGYQWMIGPSLMATPLYGDDYATASTRDVYLPKGTWIDYDTGESYQGPKTLQNFAIPVEKTPLFVGGAGVVVEKDGDALHARIYPVARKATYTHRDTRGEVSGTIEVNVADWKAGNVKVTEKGGDEVKASPVRHALDFVIQPGKSYVVTN